MSGFKLYWIHPVTGEVGAYINPESGGSFTIALNSVEELPFTVHKNPPNPHNPDGGAPHTGGALLTHTGADSVEYPIVAGYIADWGKETLHTLEIKIKGIRGIFENRTIWQHLEYRGTTLGEIAWQLCLHGMDRPGGHLPITRATPDQETAARERTYEKWNVSNNLIGKRWKEITEVINGPDLMFRPKWANKEHTLIEWEFCAGGEAYPFIPQAWVPDFDTTPALAQIEEVSITSTGKDLVNRVWCTGSGEGEGTAIAFAENLRSVYEHNAPFIEAVMSDSDQSTVDVLRQKAEGALQARQEMIDQVTLSFLASSPKTPLGSFHVGDTANVTLAGWLSIPDGTRAMRIIKMSGDLSGKITLDFQEAKW
ncbi:hypothetical protein [Rothia aeria]|uniref:hypothetical protein n=1 Tax=Rothia aeria TaxID=172042 RepID=UPI0028D777CD|nr:hypothetical protein [Rothia aeria]